jgi:hypothetical protein
MRDAEQMSEDLLRRRGEGLYTPLRKMLSPPASWQDRFAPDYGTCASTRCSVADGMICPGDTVLYDGSGRQVHEDCEVPGA